MNFGVRLARGRRSATAAALIAVFVASCSSTSEPSMELAQSGTEAGAPAVDLQLADGAAPTGEGDQSLPKQTALPTSKRDDKTKRSLSSM